MKLPFCFLLIKILINCHPEHFFFVVKLSKLSQWITAAQMRQKLGFVNLMYVKYTQLVWLSLTSNNLNYAKFVSWQPIGTNIRNLKVPNNSGSNLHRDARNTELVRVIPDESLMISINVYPWNLLSPGPHFFSLQRHIL